MNFKPSLIQPNITTTALDDQIELELTPAENKYDFGTKSKNKKNEFSKENSGVKGLAEWANEETTEETSTGRYSHFTFQYHKLIKT